LFLQLPVASQVLVPVQVSASSALVTVRQAPVAQLRHEPLHATGQHFPSAQKPEAHWLARVHACPGFSLHAPLASQVLVPVQESASSALLTAAHAPCWPLRLQAWHAPHDAALQHTPSTQFPDAQSVPAAHVCVSFFRHAPLASHVLVAALHVSASSAFVTVAHVPTDPERLHAWHVPQLPAAQHTPSTQFADAHCVPPLGQLWPILYLQLPLPSQVLVPPQVPSFVPSATGQHAPGCPLTLHA
jgi:hypothetical protein